MEEQAFSSFLSKLNQEYALWKMQQFLNERIKFVLENSVQWYPVELLQGSYFVMHLIPENAFQRNNPPIDLKQAVNPDNWILPIATQYENTVEDYNFDGLIYTAGTHQKRAYNQLFRNGIVESVVSFAYDERVIHLLRVQQSTIRILQQAFAVLPKLGVKFPFYLIISLLNVRDVRLVEEDVIASGYDEKGRNRGIARNELILPELLLKIIQMIFRV